MVKHDRHPAMAPRRTLAYMRSILQAGLKRRLGARLLTVTEKKVTAEMPVRKVHLNHDGRVNGGVLMGFADSLGAMGTLANLPHGYHTATLESKTNFFAAGVGQLIKGVSVPLHIGRTTSVWQTTLSNQDGRTVAIVTQTQMFLQAQPRPAAVTEIKPARKH